MKELRLFLALLLAPLAFQAAVANDADDIARAATRRNTPSAVQSSRQKTNVSDKNAPQKKVGAVASRATNIDTKKQNVRERTAIVGRTDSTTIKPQTAGRTTTQRVQARPVSVVQKTMSRSSTTQDNAVVSRVALPSRTAAGSRTDNNSARTSGATNTQRVSRAALMARSGTELSASDIISRDYKKCREVFYSCMDEFCANKDSQLRRCACSSRINEFYGTKQRLAQVEDKLLDFSQRLLTVNMDAEDAAALNQATEGELAFYESGDKSTSKKMLDEIAKKLNSSFDDAEFDQGLNAINLSLNTGAAFDSVDSMFGSSATTKSGTELHAAALPICREMALEVCSPEELSIAEGGYQVMIEQDCNTVAKSYATQSEDARKQILESSALLDISRLDVHQKRNSDDVLTCKKKMVTMLTDSTVCGSDMSKCLDMTGQYIDPSTGGAFLTVNLSNLGNLITRPASDETWRKTAGNEPFVSFLNSKKKFLEPAMEKCQDVADYVWDLFIEDALAQIKLAQDAKLEDVRQSCTTLTTQCLDNALDSITEFDARALSVFGITADITANTMCEDVKTACTALLDTIGSGEDWGDAMDGIASTKSYDSIITTCREVGKNCIIQNCKSASGNFGLCESITMSVNRSSIVNRSACWETVYNCVNAAGAENVAKIMRGIGRIDSNDNFTDYQDELYVNVDSTPIHNYCNTNKCSGDAGKSDECAVCRITEQLWGNCTNAPNGVGENNIIDMDKSNSNETLLSWFARNTGTEGTKNNCSDTTCGYGYTYIGGECWPDGSISTFGGICRIIKGSDGGNINVNYFSVDSDYDPYFWTDCCPWGTNELTFRNHCCHNAAGTPMIPMYNDGQFYFDAATDPYNPIPVSGGDLNKNEEKHEYSHDRICAPFDHQDAAGEHINIKGVGNALVYTVLRTDEYAIYCNVSKVDQMLTFEDNKIYCPGRLIKVLYNGYTSLLNESTKTVEVRNAVGIEFGTSKQQHDSSWYHEVKEDGKISCNGDKTLEHWTIRYYFISSGQTLQSEIDSCPIPQQTKNVE